MAITEMAGWIGMILVLTAYFLISFNKISSQKNIYQVLNLLGVLGIGINVFAQKAWPVFVLECIWATIAIISLFRIYYRKKRLQNLSF